MPLIINGQKVSEVICLNCYRRWITAREVDVPLRDLECPTCGKLGYAIETGETTCAEELIRMAREEVTNHD